MNNERPNAVFNIGSQHGNISNVAGDMTVHGGQQYIAPPADMILPELARLRRALSAIHLDPDVEQSAGEYLAAADAEVRRPHPDARRVARPIERLTRLLKGAGVILAAGAALINPLQSIASLLGAAGQVILHLLA
jgi:hypothetical protein